MIPVRMSRRARAELRRVLALPPAKREAFYAQLGREIDRLMRDMAVKASVLLLEQRP